MKIEPSDKLKSLKPYAFAEIEKKVDALREAAESGAAKLPIDFGVGDPSEPTPKFVIDYLSEAALKHEATGYPSYVGSQNF